VVKKPNIIGSIHNIILFVEACRGSAAGIVVTFCMRNIDKPTRTGSIGVGSLDPRSNHKKVLFKGIDSLIPGSQG